MYPKELNAVRATCWFRCSFVAALFYFILQQIFICFPPEVSCNPQGGSVAAGKAAIIQQGNTLTVTQSTPHAVINWQGFSIAGGETTRFIQPSVSAAVLNRVTGFGPSRLDGSLTANGQVFLINPNGVVIGPQGRIETGGFFASTLNIPDAVFMAGGDLEFAGDSAAGITNLGTITAHTGDIILAARTVENSGTLQASGGVVGLAAGNEVLYRPGDALRLFVKSALTLPEKTDGVTNTGLIEAAQTELRAAGGNIYALAVNNGGAIHATGASQIDGRVLLTSAGGHIKTSGTISATKSSGDGGEIRLQAEGEGPAEVTVSGSLEAKGTAPGTRGGNITITGDKVTLTEKARLNAGGDAGGGLVRIGGDYQGANPDVFNATKTVIEAGAEISADAVTSGDGGRVIVWSDDDTRFLGRIWARGGLLSGDGGFAEVSGHHLFFNGLADMRAPQGRTGTLLLDPNDVYISDKYDSEAGEPTYFSTTGISALLDMDSMDLEIKASNVIYFESGVIAWTSGRKLSLMVSPLAGYDAAGLFIGANEFLPGRIAPQIIAPNGSLYLEPWEKWMDYNDVVINAGAMTIKPVVNPPSGSDPATGTFNVTGKIITPSLTVLAGGHTSCASGNCYFSMDNAQNAISSIVIGDGNGPTPRDSYLHGLPIQALPGDFSIYSSTSTSVETKGWVQFEGDVTIRTGGNLTLKNYIGFDTQSLNEQLVLSAAGNFINAAAASDFQVPATGNAFKSHFPWVSRALIFSTDPRLDTLGDLPTYNPMDGRIYAKSYANLASIPAGDWSVYSLAPIITLKPTSGTRVYGEADPASLWTAAGIIEGDTISGTPTLTLPVTEQSSVGSYNVALADIGTVSGPSGYQFQIDNDPAGTLTITKKDLTIYLQDVTRQYGEENPSSFPATYSGMMSWDMDPISGLPKAGVISGVPFKAYTSLVGGTEVTQQTNVGASYWIMSRQWQDTFASQDYNLTWVYPANMTITPAPLTITANNLIRRIGDPNPNYTVTYGGLKAWDDPNDANVLVCCGFNSPPASDAAPGNYPIIPSGGWARNYTITDYFNGTFTIKEPYQLVITADNTSKVYGNANPAFTASYFGFEDGDTPAVVTSIDFSTPAVERSPVGTYSITPESATLPAYYTVTYVPGYLTVTPRDLILRADDTSAQYGTIPAFTYTVDTLLAGDSLSSEPTRTGGGSNVGTHPITLTGGEAANYNIIRQNGTLVITPAPLFVGANDAAIYEGQSYPVFTASYTGLMYYDTGSVVQGLNLIAGDDSTVSGSNTLRSIIQSGTLTAANYFPITFTQGTLTIKPKPPEIINVEMENITAGLVQQSGQLTWMAPFGVPETGAQALRYVAKNLILKLGLKVDNVDVWLADPANRALLSSALLDFLNAPLQPGELYNQREAIKDALQTQIRETKVKVAEEAVAAYNVWKEERKVEFQQESGRLMTLFGDVAVPDVDFEAEAMATMITTGVSAATLAAVATLMSATGTVLAGSSLAGCTFVTTAMGTSLVTAQTASALAATGGQLGATLGVSTAGTVLGPGAIVVAAIVVGACRISQVVEKYNTEQKYANLVENARNFDINTLINADSTAQNELASFLMLSSMRDYQSFAPVLAGN